MTKDGHNEFDLSGSFVRDIIYVFGCLYLFSILGDKFGWLLVSFSFSDENLVGCLYLFQFQAINWMAACIIFDSRRAKDGHNEMMPLSNLDQIRFRRGHHSIHSAACIFFNFRR